MNKYSSTSLKLMNKHCAQALTFAENGEPMDLELFQVGIAAHAVLQEFAVKRPTTEEEMTAVATATVTELLTKGRSYNGVHEPPMAPDQAFSGRDLAVNWYISKGLPEETYLIEEGLGITSDGSPCDYDGDPACRYRGIFDLTYVDIEGDEDSSYAVLAVRDYKSAWSADASELETLQRKGQAVLAWRHLQPESSISAIRMEVCNLRTGMTHKRIVMLDPEGEDLLARWEKDILQACAVADLPREARPGANCLGCPYVLSCADCYEQARNSGELVEAFAAAQALRDEYFVLVKGVVDGGDMPVPGGRVGYYAQARKKLKEDGHVTLAEYWADAAGEEADISPSALSLLKAIKMGSTQIENAAKVIYPGRGTKDDREALMAKCTTPIAIPVLKVWKE